MQIRAVADKEKVKKLRAAIRKNNGYCPCKLEKINDNKCMCKEFVDAVQNGYIGKCHCGLYESV